TVQPEGPTVAATADNNTRNAQAQNATAAAGADGSSDIFVDATPAADGMGWLTTAAAAAAAATAATTPAAEGETSTAPSTAGQHCRGHNAALAAATDGSCDATGGCLASAGAAAPAPADPGPFDGI